MVVTGKELKDFYEKNKLSGKLNNSSINLVTGTSAIIGYPMGKKSYENFNYLDIPQNVPVILTNKDPIDMGEYCGFVVQRSSYNKLHLMCLGGWFDVGYRGVPNLMYRYMGFDNSIRIMPGDEITQLILLKTTEKTQAYDGFYQDKQCLVESYIK